MTAQKGSFFLFVVLVIVVDLPCTSLAQDLSVHDYVAIISDFFAAAFANLGADGRAGPVAFAQCYGDLLRLQIALFGKIGVKLDHILTFGGVTVTDSFDSHCLSGLQIQEGGSRLSGYFLISIRQPAASVRCR